MLILILFWITNVGRGTFLIRKYRLPIVFSVLYFFGYATLYAWYNPIGEEPRFIFSLYLPALFLMFLSIHCLINSQNWHVFGYQINQEKLF